MIYSKLQDRREAKNLSQTQLAKAANINPRTLQNYEQGIRSVDGANIKTLLKLSRALDCKIEDITNDPELSEMLQDYYTFTISATLPH